MNLMPEKQVLLNSLINTFHTTSISVQQTQDVWNKILHWALEDLEDASARHNHLKSWKVSEEILNLAFKSIYGVDQPIRYEIQKAWLKIKSLIKKALFCIKKRDSRYVLERTYELYASNDSDEAVVLKISVTQDVDIVEFRESSLMEWLLRSNREKYTLDFLSIRNNEILSMR